MGTGGYEQLNLFHGFLEQARSASSDELSSIIDELRKAKQAAAKREQAEKQRQAKLEAERQRQLELETKKEHIKAVTSMDLPMDWENAFFGDVRTQDTHTDSIPDALVLSLSNLGRVDIEYIAAITGADCKTVISTLKGSIYQNPEAWNECFYKGWETANEYLSGNLLRKRQAAVNACKEYDGYFVENIQAIDKALPPMVTAEDIYITLGSPWVPVDIIDEFIKYILEAKHIHCFTCHDEVTGTWEISNKKYYQNNIRINSTYGTSRIGALHILEKTLNMKTVSVKDKVSKISGSQSAGCVINNDETALALEKQKKLVAEFQTWVWKDNYRKRRLEKIFEQKFGCVRRRIFDGSFLQFPTLSKDVTLYPYQKDAVARILFSPNTLLAHDVGSGKTYIMIAAGMELRRMGLSKKNLYVVPNNIVGQWKNIFSSMYPEANMLCVEPKSFTPQKREAVLEAIRDNEYDGIIMAYSCFTQIPISKEYYMKDLETQTHMIRKTAMTARKATYGLRRKEASVQKALSELAAAMEERYDTVYFDELGITRLFVDEAHNFKNVPIDTKIDKVLGISAKGSAKCRDMMDKVHLVQKQNNGGGVIMATGTPITNSIADAYVMQQYLQSGELTLLELQSFDSWIGTFAERVTEFEVDVDTNSYRLATRFTKFHNLPELTLLLSSIADFHQVDETACLPIFEGYKDALLGKTSRLATYLDDISIRADEVRKGLIPPTKDNMLKITTDGRKAALDLRLVDPAAPFSDQSKVMRCAENVAYLYRKTSDDQCTQLIFCDTSTPKQSFNIYDELKRLLTALGIPENQIAYVHNAETEAQRSKLFAQVRTGDIRVLIGSTFKLGLGVNIQDRLAALHHLDVPWRPADMVQREGRILRQGNQCNQVYIFRYVTEGSFDSYSWQLLETKQRFITSLLSGSLTERSGSDIDDTVLDYAEVKALAVGNPLIKQRVEAKNELEHYRILQRKAVEIRLRLEQERIELPRKIAHQQELIRMCNEDGAFYRTNKQIYSNDERRTIRKQLFTAVSENILSTRENPLLVYQGFQIVLPANMTKKKPFIWLQREGRYYVELGDTEAGGLIRIDHFLDRLNQHLNKLTESLSILIQRGHTVTSELEKTENYTDRIKECQQRLTELDRRLGVNNL